MISEVVGDIEQIIRNPLLAISQGRTDFCCASYHKIGLDPTLNDAILLLLKQKRDYKMPGSEKREHQRYNIDGDSEIIFEQPTIEGAIKDISFGGFFLHNSDCLSDHENKEVDVKIETSLDETVYRIEGRCRIARVGEDGLGLVFINMDDENIATLNRVILNLRLQVPRKDSAG